MATEYRTAHAGELSAEDIGRTVRLAGWVDARRDHGGVAFVDLRDASGVAQVVLNPEDTPAPEATLRGLRSEFCISVEGVVRARPEGTVNPGLATGEVEVAVSELTVLAPSAPLPFQLDGRADVEEARRLGHRYLDLRTPRMQENLKARSKAVAAMRKVMDGLDFLDVETPTLVASTPEGARPDEADASRRAGQPSPRARPMDARSATARTSARRRAARRCRRS